MGNRKTSATTLVGLAAVCGLFLTGCASEGQPTGVPPEATTPTSSTDASGAANDWPDGADADTPSCQDASAAVLAVVNESLREASATNSTVESVLPWLSARPDPDLGVWTLTGLLENAETAQSTEGGYFVVFATKEDPTSPTFDGAVSALGAAAGVTTLPPLEPAYIGASDMDDVPPAALRCGTQRSQES